VNADDLDDLAPLLHPDAALKFFLRLYLCGDLDSFLQIQAQGTIESGVQKLFRPS